MPTAEAEAALAALGARARSFDAVAPGGGGSALRGFGLKASAPTPRPCRLAALCP